MVPRGFRRPARPGAEIGPGSNRAFRYMLIPGHLAISFKAFTTQPCHITFCRVNDTSNSRKPGRGPSGPGAPPVRGRRPLVLAARPVARPVITIPLANSPLDRLQPAGRDNPVPDQLPLRPHRLTIT